MSTDPQAAPRPLPDRPNLRHLKDQAKDLVKAGAAESITDARFTVARLYGFPSWPKLKAHVELLELAQATKSVMQCESGCRTIDGHHVSRARHDAQLDGALFGIPELHGLEHSWL